MITPTKGKILILILQEPTKSTSGIYLARTKKEIARRGLVIAIGKPNTDKWGKSITTCANVGDVIHMRKYTGQGYRQEGKQYLFIKSDNVIGVER